MRFNRNVLRTEMPPLVEIARRAVELTEDGIDVIRADQGAVDIPPPAAFIDRVAGVLSDPAGHRYAPDPGLPELREALARYGSERFGVDWDPGCEIIVTTGANQACYSVLSVLAEPGDEVLLPSPWYFNHAMALTALGAVPVPLPTAPDETFAPRLEAVARAVTSRTRGIALVNPNNPTGVCYGTDLVRSLAMFAAENGLWILSDQTYHELHYGDQPPLSPASVRAARDSVVTVGSFSKSFGVAGWRLGFLAGPADLVAQVLKIQDSSVICAVRAGQEGLVAALEGADGHVTSVRATLRQRRDTLVGSLRSAGIESFVEPAGSLFLFLRLPEVDDDLAFCRRLLEEQHVAAVPGIAFGPGGEGSIRLSFGSIPESRLPDVAEGISHLMR